MGAGASLSLLRSREHLQLSYVVELCKLVLSLNCDLKVLSKTENVYS